MDIFPFGSYPSLRVAYIDELEEPNKDNSKKVNEKAYYSCLVKAALPNSNSSDPVQNLDQVKAHLIFCILKIWGFITKCMPSKTYFTHKIACLKFDVVHL